LRMNEQLLIAGASTTILLGGLIGSVSIESIKIWGWTLPSLCGFRLLTGWDCPGCGLTRSILFTLRGDFAHAYFMHIWGIPVTLLLAFQIPYRLYRFSTSRTGTQPVPDSGASVQATNTNNRFFKGMSGKTTRRWLNHVVFLSLLIPWILKTVALAIVRYL